MDGILGLGEGAAWEASPVLEELQMRGHSLQGLGQARKCFLPLDFEPNCSTFGQNPSPISSDPHRQPKQGERRVHR